MIIRTTDVLQYEPRPPKKRWHVWVIAITTIFGITAIALRMSMSEKQVPPQNLPFQNITIKVTMREIDASTQPAVKAEINAAILSYEHGLQTSTQPKK